MVFDEKCNKMPLAPCPARAVIDQLESRHIRDKIRIPRAVALDHFALAAEKSLFAAEAFGKREWIAENKIEITKPVDHHRRATSHVPSGARAPKFDGSYST